MAEITEKIKPHCTLLCVPSWFLNSNKTKPRYQKWTLLSLFSIWLVMVNIIMSFNEWIRRSLIQLQRRPDYVNFFLCSDFWKAWPWHKTQIQSRSLWPKYFTKVHHTHQTTTPQTQNVRTLPGNLGCYFLVCNLVLSSIWYFIFNRMSELNLVFYFRFFQWNFTKKGGIPKTMTF